MYIKQFHVENFGPLRDCTIDFEPLTVLLGPNDAGKTFVRRALSCVSSAVQPDINWNKDFSTRTGERAFDSFTFNNRGGSIRFAVNGDFAYRLDIADTGANIEAQYERLGGRLLSLTRRSADEGPSVVIEGSHADHLGISGKSVQYDSRSFLADRRILDDDALKVKPIHDVLAGLRYYQFIPWLFHEAPNQTDPTRTLGIHGEGLFTAIADLLLDHHEVYEQFIDTLRESMPQVRHVKAPRSENGFTLIVETTHGARVPAESVSDGLLLYLAFLVVIFHPKSPRILFIEEPETGLHPRRLSEVIQLLKKLTEPGPGRIPVQVILTTHSPLLLNYVDPKCIQIVRRNDEGATTVVPMAVEKREVKMALELGGPGEIWANFDEDFLAGD